MSRFKPRNTREQRYNRRNSYQGWKDHFSDFDHDDDENFIEKIAHKVKNLFDNDDVWSNYRDSDEENRSNRKGEQFTQKRNYSDDYRSPSTRVNNRNIKIDDRDYVSPFRHDHSNERDWYSDSNTNDINSLYDRDGIEKNYRPYAGRQSYSDSYDKNFVQQYDHRGKGPKGYKRSDERICEDICDTMERCADLDASDIEVSVKNAEVKLSGTVTDRRTKHLAEDIADSAMGVVDVINNIRVTKTDFNELNDKKSMQKDSVSA